MDPIGWRVTTAERKEDLHILLFVDYGMYKVHTVTQRGYMLTLKNLHDSEQ